MLFFLLFTIVSAQNEKIPDPPKVDLDISTLQLYGFQQKDITEINRPGQLDRLLSKKLDSNVTDISQLLNQGYSVNVLAQGFVNSTNYTLNYFDKRPERDIVYFFTAQLLNVMYRIFQRMVDFDDAAVQTVMNLTEYDNTKKIVDYCQRNIIVQAIAGTTIGSSNSKPACNDLANMILPNPDVLQSYLVDALSNKIQIIKAVRNIEDGMVNILPVITPSPLPTTALLQKPQVKAMKDALKDYETWVKQLEKNEKFNKFVLFGQPMEEYRKTVMEKANTFFGYYPQ